MIQYNDNELLYLINECSEEAYSILNQKYKPLILSKIKKYNLRKHEAEEYYSEALICFHKAIKTYDDKYFISFNRYFDMILSRKFIDLNKKKTEGRKNNLYGYIGRISYGTS